jgi:tyrosine-protein phosphatase
LPHIWLGAEENARDTSGLKERGIGYVLNVAKEVVLADEEIDGVVYLHLPWSHGQTDLVKRGFTDAMKFVDEALARNTGVLIQCALFAPLLSGNVRSNPPYLKVANVEYPVQRL